MVSKNLTPKYLLTQDFSARRPFLRATAYSIARICYCPSVCLSVRQTGVS